MSLLLDLYICCHTKQGEKEQEKESPRGQESATTTSLPIIPKSDILNFSSIVFSLDLTLSPSF